MPFIALGKTECSQRRTAMLAVWVEWGHSEEEIRAMVKGPLAIKPLGQASQSASESQSLKRRSRSLK